MAVRKAKRSTRKRGKPAAPARSRAARSSRAATRRKPATRKAATRPRARTRPAARTRRTAAAGRAAPPPLAAPNAIGFISQHMDYTTHNYDGVKRFYTDLLGFGGFRDMPEGPYLAIQTGPSS